jgi:tetratricopeptide (TPR) repeat protein
VLLAAAGLIASVALTAQGPSLGHYQTTATIREALGEHASSERCDIVYASGILPDRIKLLGQECDAHVESHEQYFDTRLDGRVTVFAFLSAGQKGELMGAAHTYIAKPWRREVYVQTDNYPHPVLSHELAHVVSGAFAPGPFDVAGPLGGWIPDPGRIEGFAVAAAPAEDTDYTLLEWTKALSDLGLLPPLQGLFRLSFFGQNSSTGYTVAGAVVQWLRDRHGPGALRAWYAGAPVDVAFGGKTLATLEREFREELDRVTLPARVAELAKARFDRPAIFGRRCPHVVDSLLQDATFAFEQFDMQSAVERYERGLELDPGNFTARMGLAACEQRRGDDVQSVSRYQALTSDDGLTLVQRAAAAERLADRALLAGEDDVASELYAQAARYAFDEHRARTIDVKRHALRDAQGREAIVALLIGDPRLGPDLFQASGMLGEWSALRADLGLADYLLGKNLYSRGRWQDALEYLSRALRKDIPLPGVRREALRVSIFARCATGDPASAEVPLREYLTDPALSSARKNGMQRFAKSCRISQMQ